MKLADAKNKIANTFNYPDWDNMEKWLLDKPNGSRLLVGRMHEAAELYTSDQKDLVNELVESLEASTKLLKTISRENDLGIALIILNGTIVDNEETIKKARS